MSADYGRIFKDGLWENNGVLCQMLGMCPTVLRTHATSLSRVPALITIK